MKCNPEKINLFFESDKFDEDTKDFVIKLFKYLSRESDEYLLKVCFLSLDFYTVEKDDEEELLDDDYKVIDFYTLSKIPLKLRKLLFKNIYSSLSDGFEDELVEDLKVFIPYEKWKKNNRKNKVEVLNNINL